MMNCRKATRLLSEAQERELSFRERAALKFHTAICAGCRNFGTQVKILHKLSRSYTRGAADESARESDERNQDES